MEGLRAQVGAKIGPLPVWAWALLAVLAIVGWMYFTKSGFFAPASDSGVAGAGSSADQAAGSNPDFPVGLGGLAGGGNPASPVPPAGVVPSGFDPSTGGYVSYGGGLSSSGLVSSDPTVNADNFSGGASPAQVAVSSFGGVPIIGGILSRAAGTAPYASPTQYNSAGLTTVPGKGGSF